MILVPKVLRIVPIVPTGYGYNDGYSKGRTCLYR